MVSFLAYKSYVIRSILSISAAVFYYVFIADNRFLQILNNSTDFDSSAVINPHQALEPIISHSSRRLSSKDAENPFMSEFCLDYIDDPEIVVQVKHISIVMLVHNEKKIAVVKSVNATHINLIMIFM